MNNQIKIALIDDECLFLEGLTNLLDNNNKIKVVHTSYDGESFLNYLAMTSSDESPEIVLLEILKKPMDGFELVEKLNKKHSFLNIIILSSHYKSAVYGHMIKLGVSAFLPKNTTHDLLIKTIEKVHEFGVFFTPNDHIMLASFVKNKSSKKYFNSQNKLTNREIEVLKLICLEYTNIEISKKLFLSVRTIESHRQRILEKIGAKNTVGLVIYAMSHDILKPDPKYYY